MTIKRNFGHVGIEISAMGVGCRTIGDLLRVSPMVWVNAIWEGEVDDVDDILEKDTALV